MAQSLSILSIMILYCPQEENPMAQAVEEEVPEDDELEDMTDRRPLMSVAELAKGVVYTEVSTSTHTHTHTHALHHTL